MIFVTVGSAVKGIEFTRLIKKMDEIAGKLDEKVVMQIGPALYKPRHADFFRYCSFGESIDYFKKSTLVVGHCGVGTILNSLRFSVPIIVVPRRFHFGELNLDDHQVEIAKRLKDKNLIHVVYDVEDLELTIRKILFQERKKLPPDTFVERDRLIEAIKTFLEKNSP